MVDNDNDNDNDNDKNTKTSSRHGENIDKFIVNTRDQIIFIPLSTVQLGNGDIPN